MEITSQELHKKLKEFIEKQKPLNIVKFKETEGFENRSPNHFWPDMIVTELGVFELYEFKTYPRNSRASYKPQEIEINIKNLL